VSGAVEVQKMSIDGPRQCRESELQDTLDVLDMIFHSGKTRRMGKYYPYAYGQGNLHNMLIIKADEKIVSHAAIYPRFINTKDGLELKVGCIGGVATHPEYRGRGYATAVLNDCIKKMEQEDYDISILWTDSHDFYRRLGWESAGTELCFNLNPGNVFVLPTVEEDIRLEEIASDFSEIGRVYDLKPLRSRRDIGDYPLLFNSQRRFYCMKGATTTAYVLVGDDNCVLEYGGDINIICSILRKLIEQRSNLFLKLFTPPQQDSLADYVRNLRVPINSIYLGMIRVINRKKFIGKIGIEKMRSCPSGRQSKLWFGPEKTSKEAASFKFYIWQSEHC
jgi:N-acetylglutamate synthase-like GNAT family acetyltransferase